MGDLLIDPVRKSDDIVPDGQVHEIDLPPQLSWQIAGIVCPRFAPYPVALPRFPRV